MSDIVSWWYLTAGLRPLAESFYRPSSLLLIISPSADPLAAKRYLLQLSIWKSLYTEPFVLPLFSGAHNMPHIIFSAISALLLAQLHVGQWNLKVQARRSRSSKLQKFYLTFLTLKVLLNFLNFNNFTQFSKLQKFYSILVGKFLRLWTFFYKIRFSESWWILLFEYMMFVRTFFFRLLKVRERCPFS